MMMGEEDDAEYLRLMEAIAKSEGLHATGKRRNVVPTYTPLFKHPLPVSEHKFRHEKNLQRVLSCKKEFQAIAAISQCDGWALEEVYMMGGGAVLGDKNGNSPLHIAIQMESIDCLLVLLNIGVDVNRVNSMGFTPLQIAAAKGVPTIENLLREHGAKLQPAIRDQAPDTTVLEVTPETKFFNPRERDHELDAYLLSKQSKYH